MSINAIEARLQSRLTDFAALRAKVKFDLDGEGIIFINGSTIPVEISRTDGEADCTIGISAENMLKLLEGQLNPTVAFTLGKLKVKGSMGLALKLASILED